MDNRIQITGEQKMRKNFFKAIIILCAAVVLSSCSDINQTQITKEQSEMYKTYQVHKLTEAMPIDANWDKPQWKNVEPVELTTFMGDEPIHRPKTQAKMLYDNEAVYVIFKVEDRYVRAVSTENHAKVCWDSCVEIFFTPGDDIKKGYINLETNCIGTMLSRHQLVVGVDKKPLTEADFARIDLATSLPKNIPIDPEITTPTTWTLEYRLPLAVYEQYCEVTKPAPGVKWKANFYKCGDKTSHPHWLTWSKVENDVPAFHKPEYFGTLEFVD